MKITIVGAGYVGLSIATLLSVNNDVTIVEVIQDKIDKINSRISPIKDDYIEDYFKNKELSLKAILYSPEAYIEADFIVLALPTNYDDITNYFDTNFLDDTIEKILYDNPEVNIIIKY